ncbi:MAG: hydantoinase/oxoprolinase family protein [Deltaproteobacteria bacterium]|nr:hydantoinase/oxoprolinase family protein [Deltaproteobacteria bacterium]
MAGRTTGEMLRVGIDTGGTFTDFVLLTAQGWQVHKVPSTPDNPARAILGGLKRLLGNKFPPLEMVHGTTVGTNAFLERKGARVVLLTTQGFEDVLFIGRQTRPELFNLAGTKPLPLLPRHRCLGVAERLQADGSIRRPLGDAEVQRLKARIRLLTPEAVAICLLHAYANPVHEERLAAELADLDLPLSLSSQILPEFREFERTATTVINAYLGPLLNRYIHDLQDRLPGVTLFIQQSNGGFIPARRAACQAVHTILSGPAGGVNAAWHLGQTLKEPNLLTFDMGGTSTDVALVAGAIPFTQEYQLDGYPIGIPVIDIHTVGAGGGSIAYPDQGGALRVGPYSAGADPGPVCYGRGEQITVTDANLWLGRLLPDFFLGGRLPLQVVATRQAMDRLAADLGVAAVELAQGIIRVANSHMAKALRTVSLERGYDPQDFALCCFGGAGGLHVCELAQELDVRRIIVPAHAGVLSALGMALARPSRDFSKTILWAGEQLQDELITREFQKLRQKGLAELAQDGFVPDQIETEFHLEVRYQGQSYTLEVPWGADFREAFHQRHQQAFGYFFSERPLEITTLRLRCQAETSLASWPLRQSRIESPALPLPSQTEIWLPEGWAWVPVYYRPRLWSGFDFRGPALILEDFATLLVLPQFSGKVDAWGNIHLKR